MADATPTTAPAEGQTTGPAEGQPSTTSTPAAPAEGQQSAPAEGADTPDDWKRRARHYEGESKKATKRLTELEAELEKFREASKTEQEKALDAARKEAAEKATTEWKSKYDGLARRSAVTRALAGRVRPDATDLVLSQIGLDDLPIEDDGTVDATALNLAIEKVIENYPYLAADATSGTPPAHHGDMGPKRTASNGKHDADELMRIIARSR